MRVQPSSDDEITRQHNRRLTNAILRGNLVQIERLAPLASLRTELRTGKIWMRPRTPDCLASSLHSSPVDIVDLQDRIPLGGPFEAAVMMGMNDLALHFFQSAGPERYLSHDRDAPSPLMVAADLGDPELIAGLAKCSGPCEWMHIATEHSESAHENLTRRRDNGLSIYEAEMLRRSSKAIHSPRKHRRL